MIITATAALIVIGSVALVAYLATRGGGGSAKPPVDPKPPAGAARISFSSAETPLGTVKRSWRVDGRLVVSTVTVRNDTDAPTAGRHLEVIPKQMASSAASITSTPAHVVVEDDPVLGWDLNIPAHGSVWSRTRPSPARSP